MYYHKIGTNQDDDHLVYENTKKPQWGFGTDVTDDNKYLVISVTESTSGNAFYIKDIEKCSDVIKVVDNFDNDFWVIDHVGGKLLVLTNYNVQRQ